VLDDVVDPKDLQGLWPSGPEGRTLVTTRRRDAELSEDGRRVVLVSAFLRSESLAYLSKRLCDSDRIEVLDGADRLADALGDLPLALGQATGVILDEGETCAEYLKRFHSREWQLQDLFGPIVSTSTAVSTSRKTVATTWSLAIDAANRQPPNGVAGALSALIAVLDPNGIPESVLTGDAAHAYVLACPSCRPSLLAADLRRGLRVLHRFSLISHVPDDGRRSVRMHALAQRAVRETLPGELATRTTQAAADALFDAWPTVEHDPELSRVLRQNVVTLATHGRDALWKPDGHPVLFRAGDSFGDVGLLTDAVVYWHRLATTAVQMLGPMHPDVMAARSDLAWWQGQAGDASGAAAAFDQLLHDETRILGLDPALTLNTRANLAYWLGVAGDAAASLAAFERLVPEYVRALGEDDLATLTTRGNVARCRGEVGDLMGAVAAFEEILPQIIAVYGPDHRDALNTRHELAYWRGRVGDIAAAVDAFEQLLADRVRVTGPDHPNTLATRHALAYWRGRSGDVDGAVEAFKSLLSDESRVLGPQHPDTVVTQRELFQLLGKTQPGDSVAAPMPASDSVDWTNLTLPDGDDSIQPPPVNVQLRPKGRR
jgi:hypothetical protein